MATRMAKFVGFMSLIAIVTSGCAFDIMHVSYAPARFQSLNQQTQTFSLAKDVHIAQAPCGFERTLRQKTKWELAGTIAEGEVFRSRDQTLTVECSNVFEAYLVVSQERLVGFYLPVENGFVSISDPIQIPIER